MQAFSLESKMVVIDEEFSRPHTILSIDHHFLQLTTGLLKSLLAFS